MQRFNMTTKPTALLLMLLLLCGAGTAFAQVTVSIDDTAGRPGETVTVDVDVSGLNGQTGIISYGFDVVPSSPNIVFDGIDTAGTLVATGFTNDANTATGRVGGFASTAISADSGTLIKLRFRLTGEVAGATVNLNNFVFNNGDPAIVGGTTQSFGLTVASRLLTVIDSSVRNGDALLIPVWIDPLTAADNVIAFNFDITLPTNLVTVDATQGTAGVVKANALASGFTVNANTVGSTATTTTLRVGGFGSTAITNTTETALVFIAVNAVGLGTAQATLSNIVFNNGTPIIGGKPGAITVVDNVAPVATAGTATTNEDTAIDITLAGTDADGDALTFALASNPTNGTAVLNGSTVTYTPNADYNGSDSFTFTVSDASATSAPATVDITVNPVNDAPSANDANATTPEDTAVDITLSGSDPEGDALTFIVANAPANGSVVINGSTATSTPNADFNGSDSFTYWSNDGTDNSAPATVNITVTPAGSAWLQIFHNSPDPFFMEVDVYVNGMLVVDDLEYIDATPFLRVPDEPFTVGVAPGIAPGPQGITDSWQVDLDEGVYYFVSVTGDEVNGLDLNPTTAQNVGGSPNGVDIRVYHGIDIPGAVDIQTVNLNPDHAVQRRLADDARFGAYTNYVTLPPILTNFQLADVNGGELATFTFDLDGFDGEALTLAAVLEEVRPGLLGPQFVLIDADGRVWRAILSTDIDDPAAELPEDFTLNGNYPNPFNPSTSISFDLPVTSDVRISVVDVLGREVLVVPNQTIQAGSNRQVQLNASSLASGLYVYRVEVRANDVLTVKAGTMTLVK